MAKSTTGSASVTPAGGADRHGATRSPLRFHHDPLQDPALLPGDPLDDLRPEPRAGQTDWAQADGAPGRS